MDGGRARPPLAFAERATCRLQMMIALLVAAEGRNDPLRLNKASDYRHVLSEAWSLQS
jgi:hypothetical protein